MLLNPNLPKGKVKAAIVSADITEKMQSTLEAYGIRVLKLFGKLNCDPAVKNHPDIYAVHLSGNKLLLSKNICSVTNKNEFEFEKVDITLRDESCIKYKEEVFFNCAVIGEDIICNRKYIHHEIINYAEKNARRIINVKQGYAKCNICIVDERSIITEDAGISETLKKYGYNVLLLENNAVRLPGHSYGFIGGASGKLSKDKLAFFGKIEEHPEFSRIYSFLAERNVEAVSLSDEPLTDFGSLLPIEED